MQTEHIEALADAGHKTAQAGGAFTVLSWLTSSQGGVAIGILIGVIGLVVQWYYRREQNKREAELQQLKIKLIQDGYEARAALLEDTAHG